MPQENHIKFWLDIKTRLFENIIFILIIMRLKDDKCTPISVFIFVYNGLWIEIQMFFRKTDINLVYLSFSTIYFTVREG